MLDPRAYLVRIVTRLSLNRMRTLARRRESYVGPWLPEPLLTTPDVAEDVELADSVSTAMLLVLETLGADRACGVRAARGVRRWRTTRSRPPSTSRRPPCDRSPIGPAGAWPSDVPARTSPPTERERVVERFLAAAATGDLQSLMDALAPDVVLVTDGGGAKRLRCARSAGRDKVLRFLRGVMPDGVAHDVDFARVVVNGRPASATGHRR